MTTDTTTETSQPGTGEQDRASPFRYRPRRPLRGQRGEAASFYIEIGMRPVVTMGHMAIIELLGGTHIVISSGPAGGQQLDLIVDDIDETSAIVAAANGTPSEIRRGSPHSTFVATDPEGNQLTIHSTHAIGPV